MADADERVLGIPATHLRAVGGFVGFRPADPAYLSALLAPSALDFRPRSAAETDPTFLQLIPYVVLKCGDAAFHYRRGHGGTEARLRAKRSIGVGGHVSDVDAGEVNPYRAGMLRELAEEVDVRSGFAERAAGLIYDPDTPVGAVHLGVVHVFELDRPDVAAREAAIADAGFAPVGELWDARDEFESWSRLALGHLRGGWNDQGERPAGAGRVLTPRMGYTDGDRSPRRGGLSWPSAR